MLDWNYLSSYQNKNHNMKYYYWNWNSTYFNQMKPQENFMMVWKLNGKKIHLHYFDFIKKKTFLCQYQMKLLMYNILKYVIIIQIGHTQRKSGK